MSFPAPELTQEEQWVVAETLRTGDLNTFTNFFMRLPNSGSMWLPDDAIGHYRHAFQYQQLWEAWRQIGQPDEFDIMANEYNYHLRAIWDGNETYFLYPHGNLFLDWVKPIITKDNHLALVITGTGSAKRRA